MAHSVDEALTLAERIGYPVIVRPSFVIGGLAIDFCYSPEDLERQLAMATVVDPDRPVRIDRYLEGIEVDVDAISDGEKVLIPGLLEHVERAGVHSGDSVGLFPPQTVSEGDQDLIVATMERIVLALGARGLVNAQFIVRDDGVYLIEVNPRASRTVPFMSKVTGVPMVELAVRISLGATLPELGWDGGLLPPPPFVAVKAPAFSTAKLRGVDPSVGPGMQSTGEVIGLHTDPRVALAKALLGAALVPPRPGEAGELALLSIADRDKGTLGRLADALAAAGYRLAATPGTRAALAAAGHDARPVAKLGEAADASIGEVAILDLIADGEVRLVVNTPTPRSGRGPRRGRDPAGGDGGGDPLPDRDGDRGGRRRGARPVDRRAPVGGAVARGVGAGGRGARWAEEPDAPPTCRDGRRQNVGQTDRVSLGRIATAGRERRSVRDRPPRRRSGRPVRSVLGHAVWRSSCRVVGAAGSATDGSVDVVVVPIGRLGHRGARGVVGRPWLGRGSATGGRRGHDASAPPPTPPASPAAPPRSPVRATRASASSAPPSRRRAGPRDGGSCPGPSPPARASTAFTCPPQAPSMCPPTTAASCRVQTRPGGSHEPSALWKAVPNRSQPCWNGSEMATRMFCPSISR